MGRAGGLGLLALCLLVFFLLLPPLVEGPSAPGETPLPGPPGNTVLRGADLFPCREGEQPRGPEPRARLVPRGACACPGLTPPALRTDPNGHPLGGKTYVRAVYRAFPPEDAAG